MFGSGVPNNIEKNMKKYNSCLYIFLIDNRDIIK